jgi:hypothetical protein
MRRWYRIHSDVVALAQVRVLFTPRSRERSSGSAARNASPASGFDPQHGNFKVSEGTRRKICQIYQ